MTAVKQSLVLVFWAYLGLESASVAAAVVENPERNVAIATVAGVLLAALVYMVVSAAIMGLAPADDLANSSAPFALVAGKMFGPVAGPLIACAGMLKATGTLAGWVLLTAQTSRAAADHGLLPQFFARTRAGDTPVAGLMTAGLVGTVGVLVTISPTLGQQFGLLSEAATLFCLLMYLASCAAAIKYRLRGAYLLTAIGGAFCICAIAWSSAPSLKATAVCLVVLALFYLPAMRRKYLLPDARVRTGEFARVRERHGDPTIAELLRQLRPVPRANYPGNVRRLAVRALARDVQRVQRHLENRRPEHTSLLAGERDTERVLGIGGQQPVALHPVGEHVEVQVLAHVAERRLEYRREHLEQQFQFLREVFREA